ncbi:flippase [soil metagenome]
MASNFAALSIAEVACRAISMCVMLYLAQSLGRGGYGRIEFAFSIVLWLVLLVREGLDVIATREIARHPRIVRPLVNHILAIRSCLALGLFSALILISHLTLSGAVERQILGLYGLMLLTTAVGLDFVYRGLERMSLVALSLVIRTSIYALGVALLVSDASRITWVPACLVLGEVCGIALVWVCYTRRFGLPRPTLRGGRFVRAIVRRGRPVYLIQVSQAVISSSDLLVVVLMSRWADGGLYGAPHRMATAVLTFGIIFQQVVFPSLARTWRSSTIEGQKALDTMVRVLVTGLLPVAVGVTLLADPLVQYLLNNEYQGAGLLLALGIWRIPLLTLGYLYQSALIALNREAAGVRLLVGAALVAGPLAALFRWGFGLPGAALAVVLVGLVLVVAGHILLGRQGRAPSWHYHLARPLLAALAMVPVCLALLPVHVLVAVAGGALTYFLVLALIGGLRKDDLRVLLRRG